MSSDHLDAILYDLDGTLTDPFEGISKSVLHACEKMQLPRPSDVELKRFIGPPIHASFAELLSEASPESEKVHQAVGFYRERFSVVGWKENEIFSGVTELLDEQRKAGMRLYVATSKPTVFAQKIIDHFGLASRMEHVYGSELDGTRAQKAELIAHILQREGLQTGHVAMVGDRSYDIRGAVANNVRGVGVLWGFGSQQELIDAGATAIASTLPELGQVLRHLPRKSDTRR